MKLTQYFHNFLTLLKIGEAGGKATFNGVVISTPPDLSQKADLVNGIVPAAQLPAYHDEIIWVANGAALPVGGVSNIIYITLDTNAEFRWNGVGYSEISPSVALGGTSSTAHRGDHGVAAYTHSQTAHAPADAQKNSDITKAEIEARLTGQISSHAHAADGTKQDITANTSAKTGAYTLTGADNGKIINCSGTFTITLPRVITEDLVDGFTAMIWNIGVGTVTLAIETGDTLTASATTIATKKAASVWKCTDTFWYAAGGLS